MFSLTEQPVTVTNHNARKERHGNERKLAGDLSLQAIVSAEILDYFDKQLRPTLVRERGNDEPERQKDLIESAHANDKLTRRLPQLDPLVWNEEFPGFVLVITKGLGLQEPIRLDDRKLHKFRFEVLDAGLVKLNCQCSGLYEDSSTSGIFDDLIQTEVTLTLEPPTVNVASVDPAQQNLLPGTEGEAVTRQGKSVLVTGIETPQSNATHLFEAKCTLSDGDVERVGEWAYRPSLDEIAIALHRELDAAVEFTPALRAEYAPEESEA